MARRKFIYNRETRELVEVTPETKPQVHSIQTDEIEPTESMATDQREMFTSMSKLKQHYKEHGYEITGGDHLKGRGPEPHKSDPREIRETVAKSLNDIRWGMAPMSEKEREVCRQEERNYQEYKRRRR